MPLHSQLLQFLYSGLTTGSIIALMAVGFVTIYNVTGILNFAQGEFAMLGAMLAVTFTHTGWPLPAAAVMAVVVAMAAGGAVQLVALAPARSASPVTLIIITLGVSIVLRGLALLIWGADPIALPAFTPGPPVELGGAVLQRQSLWIMALTVILMALLYLFFQRTVTGTALRACVVNPLAARLMGIRPARVATLTFMLSAGLGAAGGVAVAPITGATYGMGVMLGLKSFVAAVLGGMTSIPGAVLGGFLVGLLESFAAGLISSGYKDAITFLLLLAMLVARPTAAGAEGGAVKRV